MSCGAVHSTLANSDFTLQDSTLDSILNHILAWLSRIDLQLSSGLTVGCLGPAKTQILQWVNVVQNLPRAVGPSRSLLQTLFVILRNPDGWDNRW